MKISKYVAVYCLLFTVYSFPALTQAAMVINRTTELTSLDKDANLVGWWTMDGKDIYGTTVLDKSSSNNSLTLNSAGVNKISGKVGQALGLGSNVANYAVTTNLAPYSNNTTGTISFWAKVDRDNGLENMAISFSNTGAQYHDDLFISFDYSSGCTGKSNHIYVKMQNDNAVKWLVCTPTDSALPAIGKWMHVALVQDGIPAIYLNGSLVSNPEWYDSTDRARWIDDVVTAGANNFRVGYIYDRLHFEGSIDDVRIYSRALSATEIQNLYNQSAKKQAVTVNTSFVQATSTLNWGLVGQWSFDNSSCGTSYCLDTNPNSGETKHTGTISGGVTKVPGKFSQGLAFDGSSGAVSLGSPVIPAGNWTVSAWMKTDDLTNPRYFLSQYDGTGTAGRLIIGMNRDDPATPAKLDVFQGGGAGILTPTVTLSTNRWYHVTVVKNSATLTSYVNAVQDGTAGSAIDVQVVNTTIGRAPGAAATDYWDGSVDDVRIYNRALTVDEIRQLYNLGAQKKVTTINTSFVQATSTLNWGLVGHWTMDGKDIYGNTVLDKNPSATKNNGTKTGTVPVSGKIGQALKFNGTSDYVNGGSGSSLALTTAGTVSAWIKLNAQPAGEDGVADFIFAGKGRGVLQGADGYFLNYLLNDAGCPGSTYQLRFEAGSGASYSANALCIDLALNKWYHVVATWSGTSANLYLNAGSPNPGTIVTPGGTNYASDPFQFGAGYYNDNTTVAAHISGTIDDVRVYSRALSASEVSQLYQYGR